jgi:hypothetical protein
MTERPRGFRRLVAAAVLLVVAVLALGAYVWRDDILRTRLDPKEPFQTYDPPPEPDYAQPSAWALSPDTPETPAIGDPVADVFFISPTTFDGGRHWNAPIDDPEADRIFQEIVAPNYAGPFLRVGRVFAPRYRQASLYTLLTLREDAKEARRFAYGDVAAAFRYYLTHYNLGRPFIIVGVEQGGTLGARLIAEEISTNPSLEKRLAAAYLIQTVVPSDDAPLPPCLAPKQTGCLAAWAGAYVGDSERAQAILDRSLVWAPGAQLVNLQGRTPICFNPLFGGVVDGEAPARLNLGATNATGLEWGARPAFLSRQVGARCEGGVLRITRPKSPTFSATGSWTDRRKVPGYNLFYADLEADAIGRVGALRAQAEEKPSLRP